ncbi:DNA repair protein RecO [Gemmatimonadota bacterium]
MHPISQEAIVLGGVDYSDSSRIIWVLTPEFGRQSLMVKGAKRARSKYQGLLDTFNMVRVIYRKKSAGSLYVLREADLQRPFSGIRANLEAFWAASIAVELVREAGREEHESKELFKLLKEFLSLADSSERREVFLRTLLVAFRWRLASLMGLSPRLVECIGCGTELSRAEKYCFVLAQGGLLCTDCEIQPQPPGTVSFGLSYRALRMVYRSCRKFPSAVEDLIPLPESELKDVEYLSQSYLDYHLGLHPGPATGKLCWPSEMG